MTSFVKPTLKIRARAVRQPWFKPWFEVIEGQVEAAACDHFRDRTDDAATAPGHYEVLTSLAAAWAFHSILCAEDSCALSASSSFCTSGGKTRTRTTCLTARVCLGSVVSGNSNKRMSGGSTDTLAARWSRRLSAGAYGGAEQL